jgi:tetratricopeptide (TPR) repeat protein
MNRTRRNRLSIMLWAALLAISLSPATGYGEKCEQWVAKVVSVQGGVDVLKAGEKQWTPVRLNDTFCPWDMIRVLKQSRADILLGNESILRLDQNTTVTFSKPETEKAFLIDLLEGMAYFFSRIRRTLKVVTPFVNAIVEGTEFVVRVEKDRTFVSLFEGQVALTNSAGSIKLSKGQSAIAEANRAPEFRVVMRPRDAVKWTLYYPPVLYYRPEDFRGLTESEQSMLEGSIEAYSQRNFGAAFERIDGLPDQLRDPRLFTYRASLLLTVGRIDEARADIDKALGIAANDSDALAVLSIIAVAQNEKGKALDLAKKAVEADPRSTSARIALSYAQQANFDLEGARDTLKEAVQLSPENALAWARMAEMWLSFGNLNKALKAAKKAVELNPNLSRTQTVLGFAYLSQIKTKMSKEAFQKAIELDQADPLPRLGLGLAKIRKGDLEEGRGEIEIASSLDPNNSLIRSYLGKAYYDEKKDELASNQLAMAKELDSSDPTPYFYDAIRKQSMNQPVEALYDLQKSIELNDNRAVYRSKLLLDSDLAARSASLGRIYSDLGFRQLALVEGWKSVNADPANFSAHRFLADSYGALPRHEIARVSELLQSQLLQPININPIQPHLGESSLFILEGAGPSDPSFNEFNHLFTRDRLALQASGIAGELGTLGGEIVQSGVLGRFSYSAGLFYYQTDGFRENNDQKRTMGDLFAQYAVFPQTSVQAEFRYTDFNHGDLTQNFFGDFLDQRQGEDSNVIRLGFHHSFSPRSDLIGSFAHEGSNTKADVDLQILTFNDEIDQDKYGAELQHLFRGDRFNLIVGGGHFCNHRKERIERSSIIIPVIPLTILNEHINHTNIYLYSQIRYPKNVVLTVGASGDFLNGGALDRNEFNPKAGVTWTPFASTTLRGAVFKVITKSLIADQTIEPTQVAGFNQFYFDDAATRSWNYGAAIDQRFSKSFYGGAEYLLRDLNAPFIDASNQVQRTDWKEQLGRAYLYWTPHKWLGLSAEYQYERVDREQEAAFGFHQVRTHRFPLGGSFYHPSGLSATLKASYVNQKGTFQPQGSSVFVHGRDQFWTIDASISYRLPKRFGILTVGVKNLFDQSFKYQDIDPENRSPLFQPKRLVYGKVTLSF